MDSPRIVLLIFLLLFLFLSPDNQQPSPSQRVGLDNLITEERNALEVLRSSLYGDVDVSQGMWLNITGFRDGDELAWNALPKVQDRAREQLKNLLGEEGQRKLNGLDGPMTADVGVYGGKVQHYSQAKDGQMPLYRNVTGIVSGKWTRSRLFQDLRPPQINLTTLAPRIGFTTQEYDRNVTGSSGKLQLRLDEKTGEELVVKGDLVREITGIMTLRDESSRGDGWEIGLHGVHFQSFGGIILTTTSEKFAGIFALPHFSLSPHTYSLAQGLLNKTLSSAIVEQESSISTSPIYPWTSSPNHPSDVLFPTPRCEYVVYLQQDPMEFKVGGISSTTLKLIEDELRFPTGAPVPHAPDMAMSMILFSPDCGFVLESMGPPDFAPQSAGHLRGPKIESFLWLAKRFSSLFAIIYGLQIVLLIKQMNEAATPSTVSRISFYTIAIMAMGDGFVLMGFLTLGIYIDAAFLTLFSTAFIAFLSICVFGMRFLIAIWRVQAPERRERERSASSANGAPSQARQTSEAVATTAGTETLLLPVTARSANRAAPVVILPPDQDLAASEAEDNAVIQNSNQGAPTDSRSAISALYTRFYIVLLGLIFVSLYATSWPQTLRSVYANVLALTYLSFWTPQIYRNVMRNCRKALRWDFVVGQSALRLAPIVYVYSAPNNIMYIETDRRVAIALSAWVWVQIWVLISQEVLGPRFAIPNGWAPPAYDYHPVLREDDLESGAMPIGFTQVAEEEDTSKSNSGMTAKGASPRARGKRTWDCAICMQDIVVHIVPSGSSSRNETAGNTSTGLGSGILGRRGYMVTPCRHIFHSECLEGWMRVRLQCPICRETLPPL